MKKSSAASFLAVTSVTLAAAGSLGTARPGTPFTPLAAEYSKWKRLTPDFYAVPASLSLLCVAPAPPPSVESRIAFGPHVNTYIRVFANSEAEKRFIWVRPFQRARSSSRKSSRASGRRASPRASDS